MKSLTPLLGAALLCGALAAQAQTPQAPSGEPRGEQRARPTPEQREKMREAYKGAREACKDAQDKRGCMVQNMCSKAPDPAQCQERAKQRQARMSQHMDERQAAHEKCTGKRGDELMKCLGEQRKQHHDRKPDAKS